MSDSMSPQEQMDAAFDNYLNLSEVLRGDVDELLQVETESQRWRRHFIRVSSALIEGYAHCLREMCKVCVQCVAPSIAAKETEVLQSERQFSADERLKLTLRVAYKLFELQPAPDFGGPEWPRAQGVLLKRHVLMHPKTPSDLAVSDQEWSQLREDVAWLFKQLFDFIALSHAKYGG
jgi:hypothetical protein